MSDSRALLLMAQVLASTNSEELFGAMSGAAQELGFNYSLYGIRVSLPGTQEALQNIASAYPLAYQRIYQERDFISRDPTVHHALTRPELLLWQDGMYSAQSHEVMEESRQFGLAFGLSAPVHEGANVRGMLSLARDKPIASEAERLQLQAGAMVLANAVHFATSRIILPELTRRRRPSLSVREMECLKWAAQGKSNSVIADLTKVSEATVKFHISKVLQKLGVSTRQQAVALAVALGLIS